jgi:hypothetical protein
MPEEEAEENWTYSRLCTKTPNLTADNTDETDLRGSEELIELFHFVNPCHLVVSENAYILLIPKDSDFL